MKEAFSTHYRFDDCSVVFDPAGAGSAKARSYLEVALDLLIEEDVEKSIAEVGSVIVGEVLKDRGHTADAWRKKLAFLLLRLVIS